MENSENLNSEEKQVTPVEETNHEAKTVSQVESNEDKQERNWTAYRQKQRELERELKLQREMNEKLLQQMSNPVPKPQEIDELDTLSDEEFIPKGKVKKLVQKEREYLKKEALEEVEKLLKQKEQSRFLENLKAKFSDFDDVVNADTLEILEIQEPELAASIADLKDPYKIGIQSYKYIKALNLSDKVPDKRRVKEVEKKLEKNANTVPSAMSYDKRPMAQAYKITEAESKKLYEEMMTSARGSGFSY